MVPKRGVRLNVRVCVQTTLKMATGPTGQMVVSDNSTCLTAPKEARLCADPKGRPGTEIWIDG